MLKAPDMNTYCPGCNKSLKRKQLIACKFTLTKQDDDKNIVNKLINGDEEIDGYGNKEDKKKRKKNSKKKNKNRNNKISDNMNIKNDNLNREDNLYECGSCGKVLTNAIKSGCLSKCGHIVCLECIKKFVAKNKCCSVCDTPCKKKHVIILSSGGTGFAAHGNKIEATKKAVAFQ